MSHIVESCPLTKLNGNLSRLHSADEDAVLWLTSYDMHKRRKRLKVTENGTNQKLGYGFLFQHKTRMREPSSHRDTGLLVLVYKCLHGLAPSHLADELRPPAVWGVCVPLRLTNCLFPVPDSQPTATEHFQSPLYWSVTVFRSTSHLIRYFPSSALASRHTFSNSVTWNYCCRAREVTLSFMDTLIALSCLLIYLLTYLLTYLLGVTTYGCL